MVPQPPQWTLAKQGPTLLLSEDQEFRCSSGGLLEAKRDQDWDENLIGDVVYEEEKEDVKKALNKNLSPISFSLHIVFMAFAVQPVPSINQAFNYAAQSLLNIWSQWERRQLLGGWAGRE